MGDDSPPFNAAISTRRPGCIPGAPYNRAWVPRRSQMTRNEQHPKSEPLLMFN
jgi:hypothetical protein